MSSHPHKHSAARARGNGRRTAPQAPPRRVRAPTSNGKNAEIFVAAVRLFEQKGFHAASMQDLADSVGLQKASLYHYVNSKEDLLAAVMQRGTGALTEQLNGIVSAPLPASEKLRRAIESHLVALCDQLGLFTVFLREQQLLDRRKKLRLRAEGERHAELLEQILREGVQTGEFRELDLKMMTHAILGMCNWLYQWYSPEGPLTPHEIAEIFSTLVLGGVARPNKRKITTKQRNRK